MGPLEKTNPLIPDGPSRGTDRMAGKRGRADLANGRWLISKQGRPCLLDEPLVRLPLNE